jgi:hypothetical protein
MEKRHPVFISSTFTDLIEERREVIEALLEMDAIPAGMELFAAGDTDQWTLIQQVIDQSDYYIVIVGGRYGSMTQEGISYTEMEYDYAVAQGIPVMGFVHRDPDQIPKGKSELDSETSKKLNAFREKVKRKIVREYSTPSELGGVVSRGLHKLQKDSPRPGWVRGDLAMTPEAEARIAEMRAELAELRQAASEHRENSGGSPKIEGLASGEDAFVLVMEFTATDTKDPEPGPYEAPKHYVWNVDYATTWNDVLERVGPSLMDEASEREIGRALEGLLNELVRAQPDRLPSRIGKVRSRSMAAKCIDDVLVQLFALGLIAHGTKRRTSSDSNRYWVLTPSGQDQVMRLRAIPSPTEEERKNARREGLVDMTVAQLRVLARETHHLDGKGLKSELIDSILEREFDAL